ncbi:MAG: M4 family metallopeptidase, partial [Candidatus Hydrogenedentes bacterium]|nr:M4 family metallopeptidase [Candidatus Hydrogenedentota bacterium]
MRAYGVVAVGRRVGGLGIALFCAMCIIGACLAQAAQVNPDDLDNLYGTLRSSQSSEPLRKWQADDGFLRFVGAPPGTYFTAPQGAKAASPESLAHAFITSHPGAFTTPSSRQTFVTERVNAQFPGRTIPVFAGQVVVQTNGIDGVSCVMSDVMRDLTPLDNGALPLTPTVGDSAAQDTATQWMIAQHEGGASDYAIETPQRVVFDPAVVDHEGPATIAWQLTVASTVDPTAVEVIFVDGFSGKVVYHYPLAYEAKVRAVSDADNSISFGRLVRSEGDPPCNIKDADLAYDFLGDTYDFYHRVHNRDSLDSKGEELDATVRFCEYYECPLANAGWSDFYQRMFFGDGYAVDDVTAHELTHGVTSYTSKLIYEGQSGAINESFSDMWGEFVDLTNGKGNDTPAVRWLLGEDTPIGAIRNMKDPPEFGDPDRLNSPLYYMGTGDNGGVHINSGITNKLCYLLTDGDTFNGQTVTGLGIEAAARLFYEMQIAPLPMAASFGDFYMFLGQATVNQGYDFNQRLNVRAAAEAVEIAPVTNEEKIRGFRAMPTTDTYGRAVIALTWINPSSANFRRVILVRSTTGFPQNPSDGMQLYQGTDEKFLDIAVTRDIKYYYSLFSDTTFGFPDRATSSATAGAPPPDFLSEAFESQPVGGT